MAISFDGEGETAGYDADSRKYLWTITTALQGETPRQGDLANISWTLCRRQGCGMVLAHAEEHRTSCGPLQHPLTQNTLHVA
jgi:hypothetical protein